MQFGYGKEDPVLRDVNFVIRKGQMVGIVGPTGSGKSTVVSLIPRFYDSTAGKVMIDGTDIRNFTLAGLRQHIGFVLAGYRTVPRDDRREHRVWTPGRHAG